MGTPAFRTARAPLRLADVSRPGSLVELPSGRVAAVREFLAHEYQLRRAIREMEPDSDEADAAILDLAGRVLVDVDGRPLPAEVRDAELAGMTAPQLGVVLALAGDRADAVYDALAAFAAAQREPSGDPEGNAPAPAAVPAGADSPTTLTTSN